ncbi:MFS transporter [Brenneria tiliae]|uniref:Glycoside-pentoside-hexuronide (GPH):cation symporter n=1 Tax=Brenneria tiliae TaxID=2914984 RepID=A0ABT0N0T6_9GAMM|nr:glycoside-pentoside-hexuronide (GPH):cation symporter [Brenneria tiliae]MCL2895054.1 glycoside-pentoside-hexuronide (GPH):cation symporter [Brenneria tiliae]
MNSDKLASKTAVILYGAGDFASQLIWSFMGAYLTIYYSDVVGLTPAIIAAIMLGCRIWDVANDPIIGRVAESTRSRFGRFRPYLAFGSPVLALFSVLTFTNPFGGTSTAGVIWALITYLVTGILYSVVNIPYAALSGVMTEDSYQRDKINSSRNIGMNLGMILVNAVSLPLALIFSGSGAKVVTQYGYTMMAVVYAVISVILFLLVFFTAKEKVQPKKGRTPTLKETYKNLLSNKYLMLIVFLMFVQIIGFMGRISVSAYYVIYCLGSYALIALFLTIPSIGAVIGSLFVSRVAKKFGRRNVLMGSLFIQAIGLLVIYKAPFDNLTMVFTGCWIFGLFNVGFPLTLSMVADSVDYMELKTGIRTDGTAYATYGLAVKVGAAVGNSVGILLLGMYGYVANAEQTIETLNSINFVVNFLPVILFCVAAGSLFLWDLDEEKSLRMREQLRPNNNNGV